MLLFYHLNVLGYFGYCLQEADDLMQFHLGNVEYACGSHLGKLSAISWDQNENYPQFTGEHLLLRRGFSAVIDCLKAGLDVRCNMEVCV